MLMVSRQQSVLPRLGKARWYVFSCGCSAIPAPASKVRALFCRYSGNSVEREAGREKERRGMPLLMVTTGTGSQQRLWHRSRQTRVPPGGTAAASHRAARRFRLFRRRRNTCHMRGKYMSMPLHAMRERLAANAVCPHKQTVAAKLLVHRHGRYEIRKAAFRKSP